MGRMTRKDSKDLHPFAREPLRARQAEGRHIWRYWPSTVPRERMKRLDIKEGKALGKGETARKEMGPTVADVPRRVGGVVLW